MTRALSIAVLVLLAALAWTGYALRSAHRDAAHAALAPAKQAVQEADAAAALAKAQVETVTVRLAARLIPVDRIIHDTIPVPSNLLHPITGADSTAAIAMLPVVQQKFEGCRAELSNLKFDCLEYRATAEARFRADSNTIAKRDSLIGKQAAVIDAGLPMRRWLIGVSGGYGGTLDAQTGRIVHGPSALLGVTYRFF